jgi:hypothetical protein
MSEEKTFRGIVTRDNTPTFVANATVYLWVSDDGEEAPITEVHTDATGRFEFRAHVKPGKYVVSCKAFEQTAKGEIHVEAEADLYEVALDLALGMDLSFHHYRASTGEKSPALFATVGQAFVAIVDSQVNRGIRLYRWNDSKAARVIPIETNEAVFSFVEPGEHEIAVALVDGEEATTSVSKRFAVAEATSTVRISGRSGVDGDGRVGERVRVTMDRTEFPGTEDEALWKAIRVRSVSFPRYQRYIHHIFGVDKDFSQVGGFSRRLAELGARGVGVYRPLRDFTELFVLSECGSISEAEVFRDERLEHEFRPDREPSGRIAEELHRYLVHGELPYIDRVVKAAYPSLDAPRIGFDALRSSVFRHPLFLELWHEMSLEHGMLMRTMDAISARFQNIYSSGENDGLSNYESSPLRPLSDFFWGWIENEPLRLTARRRIQEYKHQYGPSALDGAALGVQAADVRTAFPDAFMNLMDLCEAFYREDNNTTVIADAFCAVRPEAGSPDSCHGRRQHRAAADVCGARRDVDDAAHACAT